MMQEQGQSLDEAFDAMSMIFNRTASVINSICSFAADECV